MRVHHDLMMKHMNSSHVLRNKPEPQRRKLKHFKMSLFCSKKGTESTSGMDFYKWGWLAYVKVTRRTRWRRKTVKGISTLHLVCPKCMLLSERDETCRMEKVYEFQCRCCSDRWGSAPTHRCRLRDLSHAMGWHRQKRSSAKGQRLCFCSHKVWESTGWMRKLRENGGTSHRFSSWWRGFAQYFCSWCAQAHVSIHSCDILLYRIPAEGIPEEGIAVGEILASRVPVYDTKDAGRGLWPPLKNTCKQFKFSFHHFFVTEKTCGRVWRTSSSPHVHNMFFFCLSCLSWSIHLDPCAPPCGDVDVAALTMTEASQILSLFLWMTSTQWGTREKKRKNAGVSWGTRCLWHVVWLKRTRCLPSSAEKVCVQTSAVLWKGSMVFVPWNLSLIVCCWLRFFCRPLLVRVRFFPYACDDVIPSITVWPCARFPPGDVEHLQSADTRRVCDGWGHFQSPKHPKVWCQSHYARKPWPAIRFATLGVYQRNSSFLTCWYCRVFLSWGMVCLSGLSHWRARVRWRWSMLGCFSALPLGWWAPLCQSSFLQRRAESQEWHRGPLTSGLGNVRSVVWLPSSLQSLSCRLGHFASGFAWFILRLLGCPMRKRTRHVAHERDKSPCLPVLRHTLEVPEPILSSSDYQPWFTELGCAAWRCYPWAANKKKYEMADDMSDHTFPSSDVFHIASWAWVIRRWTWTTRWCGRADVGLISMVADLGTHGPSRSLDSS